MTLTELKARLETLPDTSRVSLGVFEYEAKSSHSTGSYFPLHDVWVRGDELVLMTVVKVEGPLDASHRGRNLVQSVKEL